MTLDPDIQAILDRGKQAMAGVTDPWNVAVQREMFAAGGAANAPEPPPMARVEDLSIPGPGGAIPARLYEAGGVRKKDGPPPLLLYFHGGGWVLGSVETHDVFGRVLSAACDAVVVSVDYRLAPEHVFPAAVDDAWAATRWAAAGARSLDADPARLVVAGDSAGGNLAAVVSLMARDAGAPAIAAQLLLYPVVDFTAENESRRDFATGYGLTVQALDWFAGQYLDDPSLARDPRVSPLLAPDHAGLPPAVIMVGACDPLRDEVAAYAETLRAAGVPVTYACWDGMTHGFLRMGGKVARSNDAVAEMATALRAVLA